MVNRDSLNDLARKITSLLPENVQQMQDDLESNIHTLLQNALSKMNPVSYTHLRAHETKEEIAYAVFCL